MAELTVASKAWEQRWREAKLHADSDFVPVHFRGKPANCFIAIEIAERLKMSVLMVMQNTYIVQGKIGFMAQFVIAVVNASGRFEEPLEFELSGDTPEPSDPSFAVRCSARRKGGKRDIKGPWVTWGMVKAEGWSKNPKWLNLGDLMFRYRAAAFFSRTICPELMMGFQTVEELEDAPAGEPMPHHNGNGHAPPPPAATRSLNDLADAQEPPHTAPPAAHPPIAPSAEPDAADAAMDELASIGQAGPAPTPPTEVRPVTIEDQAIIWVDEAEPARLAEWVKKHLATKTGKERLERAKATVHIASLAELDGDVAKLKAMALLLKRDELAAKK